MDKNRMMERKGLKLFVEWYRDFHSSRVMTVFETCVCGHYKSTPKETKAIIKECIDCGYIKKLKDGQFKILV